MVALCSTMTMTAPPMYQPYSRHNDGGLKRMTLPAGKALSLMSHRLSARQSNVGTLSLRRSNGMAPGDVPVRSRRACSPARLPKASTVEIMPPIAPVPKL